MLRGLLDSGCSKSIILRHFVSRSQRTNRDQRTVTYNTYGGGTFRTKSAASVGLKLIDEFSNSKTIKWTFQVDEYHHHEEVPYDMIIGSDLMAQLGLDIKYSSRTIEWQGDSIPMKGVGELTDPQKCEAVFFANTQSPILQQEEERQAKILDADYSKVDIDAMVDDLEITDASKEALKTTLKKFPTLFGGGLGLLKNIKPVTIELQPGVKPVHQRY